MEITKATKVKTFKGETKMSREGKMEGKSAAERK